MASPDLPVTAQIALPGGGWLALQDPANGYELHSDCFAERQQDVETKEASNIWTEGKPTVRAKRGNAQDTLAVWVSGATPYQFATRMKTLTDCLIQVTFQIIATFDDLQETYDCFACPGWRTTTSREYRFATTGLLRASVPMLPEVTINQVVP